MLYNKHFARICTEKFAKTFDDSIRLFFCSHFFFFFGSSSMSFYLQVTVEIKCQTKKKKQSRQQREKPAQRKKNILNAFGI